MGGSGSTTLGLCLMLLFLARSQQFKSLGKLAIGPQIFTMNEPLTFGIPIVLNPLMVIPFTIVALVLTLMAYGSMAVGMVPYPNGINIPWTTPPIIAGCLVSGWQGALLNVVQIIVSALIYYPFFQAADNKAIADERNMEAALDEEAAAVVTDGHTETYPPEAIQP